MSGAEIAIGLVIGLAAGVLGGTFGIGGGLLIVPALVFALGFSQTRAQGTSLVALLAPVGLLALMEYVRKGEANLRLGAVIALGFFLGGYVGARVALSVDPLVLRRGFAAFLVLVAGWLAFGKHP